MHPTLRMVDRFDELLQRQHDDTPYEYQSIFSADGFFARRASQKKLKFLKNIDVALRKMLEPGERVLFLSSGVLYSFWEMYLLGLPMYYLSRRALVLTSERLILIQINSRRKPKELRSHVLLSGIERIKRTLGGNTQIRVKAGTSYTVAYVPRRDRKQLIAAIESARGGATTATGAADLENLCPHCYSALPGHPEKCAACGGGLKSARTAALRSLLFPGLGDWYIGHRKIAVLEMVIAAVIWLGVLLPDPQNPMPAAQRLTMGLIVILFVHGMDSATTHYIAQKGHYPAGKPAGQAVTA